MDDMMTMCFFGMFVLFGFLFLMRLMSSFASGGSPYDQRGSVTPTQDDPDIGSRGAFGGGARRYDNPDVSSRGFFGRSGGSTGGGLFKSRRSGGGLGRMGGGRKDNSDIGSRGGFGRDK